MDTATSFGLGSLENPILIDRDNEEEFTRYEPGSAQIGTILWKHVAFYIVRSSY
jgi:hypothetical protein